MDDLRGSVKDLTSIPVDRSALNALSKQLSVIRADLRRVRSSASGEYVTEVDQVESALDDLRASVQQATADPTAAGLGAVLRDVGAVGSAVSELGSALGDTC
jgi:hypothetical protein